MKLLLTDAKCVQNAATHAKEGAADAVSTVKHGGKNQEGGEVSSSLQSVFASVAQLCFVRRFR